MKCSKKFKLLSSLSTVVVAVSLTATSCAAIAKNSNSNSLTSEIDINTISWVRRSKYDAYSSEEIVNYVINDNINTFVRYPGLEDVINISADTTSVEGKATILITIISGETYTGSTTWDAACNIPSPEIINIATLPWVMRKYYDSNEVDKITTKIKSDNEGGSGAQISSWDNISVNVAVENYNISINIIVSDANEQYYGNIRWSAIVQLTVDLSSLLKNNFKANSMYGVRTGRQATVYFYGLKTDGITAGSSYELAILPNMWWPMDSVEVALCKYSGDYVIGTVWINAGSNALRLKSTSTAVASNETIIFSITYPTRYENL